MHFISEKGEIFVNLFKPRKKEKGKRAKGEKMEQGKGGTVVEIGIEDHMKINYKN